MEENKNTYRSESELERIARTSFGELRQSKKQCNRLEALKYSVINDIGNLTKDREVNLRKGVEFDNPVIKPSATIKKISKENAVVEINGESRQVKLDDIDVESLINTLNQLEADSMIKFFNYPDCCVEFFESGKRHDHNVNWGGFIPCFKHKDLTLEEITQLIGRNPINDGEDIYNLLKEPEPEEIHSEKYKNFILEVETNYDGTFGGYCYTVDEGDRDENISDASPRYFSEQKALERARKFADNYKEQKS